MDSANSTTQPSKPIMVSERERKCLAFLVENYDDGACFHFRNIAKHVGLDERQVKRSVRSLVRKGLAEYHRGLFDDDGFVAGSGHCATEAGRLLIIRCKACKVRVANMEDDTCYVCWDAAREAA